MRGADVEVGKVYMVKVSGVVVPVRLIAERLNAFKKGRNFVGRSLRTGRDIRLTAAKCRREALPNEIEYWSKV